MVAFLSCRKEAISEGVSILGAGEVAAFGLGEAIEVEAERFKPSVFEGRAMPVPKRSQGVRGGHEFCGVRFACQRDGDAAAALDKALLVRERSASSQELARPADRARLARSTNAPAPATSWRSCAIRARFCGRDTLGDRAKPEARLGDAYLHEKSPDPPVQTLALGAASAHSG